MKSDKKDYDLKEFRKVSLRQTRFSTKSIIKSNRTSLIKFVSFNEQQSKGWLKLKIIKFRILDLVFSM